MSSTEPPDQASDVATNRKITVTFDRDMDPSSITTTSFLVNYSGNIPVSGAVAYDAADRTATFSPLSTLLPNTLFTATLTTDVADSTEAHLSSAYVWSFFSGATEDLTPPGVLETLPADGTPDWPTNRIVLVTFDESVDPLTVTTSSFMLAAPGPVSVSGKVATLGSRITFRPDAPLSPGVVYTVTIGAAISDLAGNAIGTDQLINFTTAATADTDPPTVVTTVPANAATGVAVNGRICVTFSEPIDPATLTAASLSLLGPGGAGLPGAVTIGSTNELACFTPSADLAGNSGYTAVVTTVCKDLAGNALATSFSFTFTTRETRDDTTPYVAMTSPIDGAANVAVNQKIVVTFSEDVDPTTVNETSFQISDTTANVVGTITTDGSTTVFTPAANLAPLTVLTATLSTDVKDLAGNALPAAVVWSFTTASGSDTTPPTVASTNPADTSTAVAIDQPINATFDEAIDPATITATSFTVVAPGPIAVTGTVTLDPTGKIATFTPDTTLPTNSLMTATITTDVHDLAGNPLAADFIWTFTTDTHLRLADIDLASASTFAVMATDSTVETGTCTVNGDVAVNPGTDQGIVPEDVNGSIHVDDDVAAHSQTDLSLAYTDAASRSTGSQLMASDLTGLTLTPGLYKNLSDVTISSGTLTLDALGDSGAVFLLQVEGAFTTGASVQVILLHGATASHVYWQVAGDATLAAGTIFEGSVLSAGSITVDAGSSVEGRLLCGALGASASVSADTSVVTVPFE